MTMDERDEQRDGGVSEMWEQEAKCMRPVIGEGHVRKAGRVRCEKTTSQWVRASGEVGDEITTRIHVRSGQNTLYGVKMAV